MKYASALRGAIFATATLLIAGLASAQPLEKVTIGLASTSVVGGSIRIADQMGLFRKHGFAPEFTVMDSASVALSALISGSVKASVLGMTELAVAQSRGQNVVAIANTYGGFGATLLLSKEVADKSKISPNAPLSDRLKVLDGLVIASPSPTSDYTFAYNASAKAVGANVKFAYMAQTAMPAALASGAIQGYIASSPNWGAQVLSGAVVVWGSGPKGELPREFTPLSSASLQMMRDVATQNPDFTKRLADVVADFVKALDENPTDVKAALAKLYPQLSAQEIDVLLASEARPWKAKKLTPADVAQDLEFVKRTVSLPGIEKIDPAALIYP